ncbi:MAG: hypothetical protein IPP57_03310 [Candidatus Obscuribacter sp.]|nr:hypothetical protein [Candidatus Obscuribacter sp.]MBK7841441.1 hypothetical protein [Candidatus Obscuribacter sp.]MBK9202469.1 hypothetical protein [Candidatus Obscuribacter sp.]MBK9618745.1 hypothetical protein [Candidatus Obscuribacter sp.]MBK9769850.1 hypothetical protein [Candidatus Obscuribacter sp.]
MSTKKNSTGDDYYPCPCCGAITISEPGSFDICKICDWEDDPDQSEDPDLEGGANELSLEQARAEWIAKKRKTG